MNEASLTAEAASAAADPAITLQVFDSQDPLLLKWQLTAELPHPGCSGKCPLPAETASVGGHLRLRAADSNDDWECSVPFVELARVNGLVLGRCPQGADIKLPHESISRRHALLEIRENGLVITDLGSTNGTSVNEQLLTPFDRHVPLPHGASLRLGATRLQLEYIL